MSKRNKKHDEFVPVLKTMTKQKKNIECQSDLVITNEKSVQTDGNEYFNFIVDPKVSL